jgi:hypothetical protein
MPSLWDSTMRWPQSGPSHSNQAAFREAEPGGAVLGVGQLRELLELQPGLDEPLRAAAVRARGVEVELDRAVVEGDGDRALSTSAC